ncbi:MAG: hypothetical protein AB2L13_01115 [Spirochaetota bacterium]
MEISPHTPALLTILIALILMLRLMHYARFYAPSYFFWIGALLTLAGVISLVHPLAFLLILTRTIAVYVLLGGLSISIISLLWPVRQKHSPTADRKIDALVPDYSFNEYHEVRIQASPERVKQTLRVTGVKDIPAARLLMKIRGIADDDVDLSDRAAKNTTGPDTFSTPDFNFFVVDPGEFITVMIIKSSMIANNPDKPAPPEITTLEQFISFNEPGYVKVAANFRFIGTGNEETLLSTETRVQGIRHTDSRVFGRYWRIIYPGSAIIRRVWLDTIKKKAEG